MSSKEPDPQGRRQQNVRLFPSQALSPRRRTGPPAEIGVHDGYVYITLSLPSIDDAELRYAIRRRYVLVWGENSPHEDQVFVLLPKPVDPDRHNIRFQNGVLDMRIRVQEPA